MKEIKVYDANDQQITMLVQWDLNIYIYIKEDDITHPYNVHFMNSENDMAFVVTSEYSDGVLKAKIPNRLLFSALPITGYVYETDDNTTYRNVDVFTILVRERAMPQDFVYADIGEDDYFSLVKALTECQEYAESAAASASEAQDWTNLSKSWAVGDTGVREGEDTDNSKYYAEQSASSASAASTSEKNAKTSETNAKTSETNAANSASESADSATLSESYAVGGTDTRTGEDTDNAKWYYEQCEEWAKSFSSNGLRYMGSIKFSELPSASQAVDGDLYNITDAFVTTSEFVEGAGRTIPAGNDVFLTTDGQWDVVGGVGGYDATEMILSGVAKGWLSDGNGNVILGSSDTGIEVDWKICQFGDEEKEKMDEFENKLDEDVTEEDIDEIFGSSSDDEDDPE